MTHNQHVPAGAERKHAADPGADEDLKTSSKFRGVYKRKYDTKWRAEITAGEQHDADTHVQPWMLARVAACIVHVQPWMWIHSSHSGFQGGESKCLWCFAWPQPRLMC